MLEPLIQFAYAGSLGGIAVGFAVGLRTDSSPAALNAVGAIVVALLPVLVEYGLGMVGLEVAFVPSLSLTLGIAGLLHAVGMLDHENTELILRAPLDHPRPNIRSGTIGLCRPQTAHSSALPSQTVPRPMNRLFRW